VLAGVLLAACRNPQDGDMSYDVVGLYTKYGTIYQGSAYFGTTFQYIGDQPAHIWVSVPSSTWSGTGAVNIGLTVFLPDAVFADQSAVCWQNSSTTMGCYYSVSGVGAQTIDDRLVVSAGVSQGRQRLVTVKPGQRLRLLFRTSSAASAGSVGLSFHVTSEDNGGNLLGTLAETS
jgi:hypothetical protein